MEMFNFVFSNKRITSLSTKENILMAITQYVYGITSMPSTYFNYICFQILICIISFSCMYLENDNLKTTV